MAVSASVSGQGLYFDKEQEARTKFDSITTGYDNLELGYEVGDEQDWIDNKLSDRVRAVMGPSSQGTEEPSSQETEEPSSQGIEE